MSNLVDEYIKRVDESIVNALEGKSKLTSYELDVGGLSSPRIKHFLNNLICKEDRYLEIGVLSGSTFIGACYENNPYAIAIDNFSQFHGSGQNFRDNCARSKITNYMLFNEDCFNVPPEMLTSISNMNVYFYDGDHKEEDQRKSLTYYINNLSNTFIFIVDDWNHPPVKTGTRLAISDTKVIVHKKWEFDTTFNGDVKSWWNGLYIAVCEKFNE